MIEDSRKFVDDYYIKRNRGMGRFVRCVTELSDQISPLRSLTYLPFPLWEQFFVYLRLLNVKGRTVIFPYNTAPIFAYQFVTTVVVVHDLMFLDEKLCSLKYIIRPKSLLSFLYRRLVFKLSYRKSSAIIFVSENVKKDFLLRFSYTGKTHTLHNTIVPDLEEKLLANERCEAGFSRDDVGFVCITGLAPTKNLKFLFSGLTELMSHAPEILWRLYLVGITSKDFELKFSYLPEDLVKRIIILENIDDERLAAVYSKSDILLFPSLEEGFGVPLIEAMAANLRIVCSNTSVMPSVCGDQAYYFDPASSLDFTNAISAAISAKASSEKARKRYLLLFSNQAFKKELQCILL